jgi:hypothetical protein
MFVRRGGSEFHDLPPGAAQSIIRRVKAPVTIPSRNALKTARKRTVVTGVLPVV